MSHGIIKGKVYYKQEKEKDRLRMGGGSWSINLGEVDTNKISTIVFCTELGHYVISSVKALAGGFERTLGGELKLVVPVKYWSYHPKEEADDTSRET